MKIYFATGNSGKVENGRNILSDCSVEQLDVEMFESQSGSIQEIALSKVGQAVEKSDVEDDVFVIADDSGLFVDNLNGFPGPLSSPFDSMVGKERLLDLLDAGADAEFRAAIALHIPDGEDQVFTGNVEGEIVRPRGDGGFGYDPLFLPKENDETWGQDPEFKEKISHRKEALIKLKQFL